MVDETLKISEQFSRYPAGRFLTDGPFSGEKFRQDFLESAIREGKKLIIDLDGTRGYGSSFLEEAFGGLVREGFNAEKVLEIFSFKSKDPSLKLEIQNYIKHAGS